MDIAHSISIPTFQSGNECATFAHCDCHSPTSSTHKLPSPSLHLYSQRSAMDLVNSPPQPHLDFVAEVPIPTHTPIVVIHTSIDMVNSSQKSSTRGLRWKGRRSFWSRQFGRESDYTTDSNFNPHCYYVIDCMCSRSSEVVLDITGLWDHVGLDGVAREFSDVGWWQQWQDGNWRIPLDAKDSFCANAGCFACGRFLSLCHQW